MFNTVGGIPKPYGPGGGKAETELRKFWEEYPEGISIEYTDGTTLSVKPEFEE